MLESTAFTLSLALPVLYAATTAVYLTHFVRNRSDHSRLAAVALWATIWVHVVAVLVRLVGERHVPLGNVGEAVSFFTLATTLVYAWLEARLRTQSLGIFILGVLLVFQTVASFRYEPFEPIAHSLRSGWFGVHAVLTIVSFSGFAIATVASGLYLLLYRELHSTRPGFIFQRIPSLEMLDEMSHRAVVLGFVLFTVGILSGMIWAQGAWGKAWSWDPKQCTSFTVWLIYGAYLFVRSRKRWTGRRAAYIALAGFVMLIFTFVFVDLVFHTEHRFVNQPESHVYPDTGTQSGNRAC